MWKITTAFLRGEVAAGNQERKKIFPSWKQQDAEHRQNFKKGGFKNQQRPEKRQDRFAKEILALDKGKFKPSPPMTTPVEKRNASKFCEFHGEVGHTTDECMHLKKQIEEMLKAEKLSHLIKELKQNNGKDQAKVAKKGEAARKDKPLAILMVQSGRKISKQRITQTFSPKTMISFPPLGEEDGMEGPWLLKLRAQPVVDQGTEEKIQVVIHLEYPEQTIAIWSTLTKEGQKKLCGLLRQNLDIFAWKPADMTGVPRHIAKHRLNVHFKDLNKACPKVGYPLSKIDWKVESLCGYPFKCFLDAYKGYHQIKMVKEDEEKTAFITSHGIFCYSKIPFGLKNVGATYQRLVDKAFQKQIGQNLEAYVDDLVIKSCTEQEVIWDVEETFKTLRKINMKLNPKKCTFGIKEGVFLGYKVNSD
ncbi:reverse transcriptase domain-containing protein [Tanacetum coccineum]